MLLPPLRFPGGELPLGRRTYVMGILNVTPDSFSDGGRWADPRRAIRHGLAMVRQGADLVDVGGESTRPGATPIPATEELKRVLPVVGAYVVASLLALPVAAWADRFVSGGKGRTVNRQPSSARV